MLDGRSARPDQLVAEDTHVRGAKPRSQINEPARIGKLLVMFRARIVHVGRTARARNAQPAVRDVLLGLLDLSISKFGARRQVHRSLQPAKLHRGKTILLREIKNLESAPGRAAKRGEADR